MRIIFALSLFAAALRATAAPPEVLAVEHAQAADAFSPVGIWQAGAGGALCEGRQRSGVEGVYDLFIVESPDLSITPGTPFGQMKHTGSGQNYDAELLHDPAGALRAGAVKRTRRYIFTLAEGGASLSMRPYEKGKRINILRWLPYLFRLSVSDVNTRPRDIDAATRIYPAPVPQTITI